MTKISIKSKFYLSASVGTLALGLLCKLTYWLKANFSSNVNFINTDNIISKALPQVMNYLNIFLGIAFIAVSIGAVSYARAHFGPATSYKVCLISLGAYTVAEGASYIYNVIYNTYNEAALKATLLSLTIEVAFIALLLFLTPLFTEIFLRRSLKGKTALSRLRTGCAILPSVSLYFVIKLAELAVYTVDATKTYISYGNTVSASVIISIILDVIYYFMLHFAAAAAVSLLFIYILTKITGPLKLKIKGDSSKK